MSNSWSSPSNIKRWERGFAALSKFREREGHCCPSKDHIEGKFKLGQWVSAQRYYKDNLSEKRKGRLNALGFVWSWRDYLWDRGFVALLKFKRREGHCYVPALHKEGNYELGYWVSTQRRYKKIHEKENVSRTKGAVEQNRLCVEGAYGPPELSSNKAAPRSSLPPILFGFAFHRWRFRI